MTLPVVIVSYNTVALLRPCIAAVLNSEVVEADIWVVDNGSHDDTAAMLHQYYPSVHLLAQPTNLGFAAANNLALRAIGFSGRETRGTPSPQAPGPPPAAALPRAPEMVLLLNPDTEVQPTAIGSLVSFMRMHSRAGMVGPQLIYPDGRFQHSAFRFPGLSQTFLDLCPLNHRLMESRLNGRYRRTQQPFAVDHPLGACMLVRAEAINAVGLLDEGYFMYVEEIDWCRRLRRAGWEVWSEPRAVVIHHEAQSTRQFREAMYVQLWRSRERYFRSYHGAAYVGLIHGIMRWGLRREVARVMCDPMMGEDERARRSAALAEIMNQLRLK